MLKHIKQDIN